MKYILLFTTLILFSCSPPPTNFSTEALNDVLMDINNKEIFFKDILQKHQNKKILISVWASWCKDCLEALPTEKELQKQFNNVSFVHLSLDKDISSWKNGIDRLQIKGDHYLLTSGWKGNLGKFLNLSWIPRYLVLDKTGKISLFKATSPSDKLIKQSLKK